MQDSRVDEYIGKQSSPQREICARLRKVIFKTYPEIKEEMMWGVPSYGGGKYYFVALKTHVNMGFSIKGLTKEQIALFSGSGKTVRTIEIREEIDLDEKQIIKLLKMVR